MNKVAAFFSKTWRAKKILRSIFSTIYFNYRYLPFKQAVKLPILLYKPRFVNVKGKVEIISDNIRFGMIRMGFRTVSIYPDDGIIWDNRGICSFYGSCSIGNASAVSIGETGHVVFNDEFAATAALKLVSYCNVTFGKSVLLGWENTVTDTDFHSLTRLSGGYAKGYAPVVIGNNNWFGMKCIVLKGTVTPDYTTVGAYSLLNSAYDFPEYSIAAGNPLEFKKSGYWLDPDKNNIEYI